MERKNFNLFRKAAKFIAAAAQKTKRLFKSMSGKSKKAGSMAEQKKSVEEFLTGTGSGAVSPKTFGEAHQRRHGHGTRPAKKTNMLKCKATAKRRRRKAA